MIDIVRLLTVLIIGNLSLLAFFAVVGVLFTHRVERVVALAQAMPGRTFLVGLVNLLFAAALIAALGSLGGVGGILALLLLAALAVGISFGLTAMSRVVGQRLGIRALGLSPNAWGSLALTMASLLPFVGWFGLLPYAGMVGLGAFILSFFERTEVLTTQNQPAAPFEEPPA